tara:strand:- start:93 stop:236 length:144 start_codon:yes stop_codon:yes gene_type:complete
MNVVVSDFEDLPDANRTIPFTSFLGENKRFFCPSVIDADDLSKGDDI